MLQTSVLGEVAAALATVVMTLDAAHRAKLAALAARRVTSSVGSGADR